MIDLICPHNLAVRARGHGFRALFLLASLLAASSPAQTLTLLKSFNAEANATGSNPKAQLVVGSGNMLYGTTTIGGSDGSGVVFKMQTGGSGFTVLWNFSGGNDGASPCGRLLLSGSTLYGTTSSGGVSNAGTVFSVNINGTGFTTLYSFSGGSDGGTPDAGLVLSEDTLYGTAFSGGAGGYGTVFALRADGGGFTNLHSFSGGDDSGNPYAELAISGAILYGTATGVSSDITNYGSIFSLSTSGSNFTVLKTFIAGDGTGANPYGGLVVSGDELYGTTESGTPGYGTVFKLSAGGGGFATLYSFTDETDGGNPYGGLVLSGGELYGTTESDGYGDGKVFRLSAAGSGFATLLSFAASGGLSGVNPYGGLVLSGSTLYGTTFGKGGYQASGNGTVFSVNTSGSETAVLTSFAVGSGATGPVGPLLLTGGTLYGTTGGGSSGDGTLFSIKTNGSGFATVFSFTVAGDAEPLGGLVLSGSLLYGTTGLSAGYGSVYKMTTQGELTTLATFDDTDGGYPSSPLTLSGGYFYGTTYEGGSNGYGTVYRITTGGTLTTLVSFTETNGAGPSGGLTRGSDGNFYGTTSGGGSNSYGTVFQMAPSGALTTLASFDQTNGSYPSAALTLGLDGNFYGTTQQGGSNYGGTVFQVTTNGALVTLVSFDYTNGATPSAGLTLGRDGNFYGMTGQGGANGYGTVFLVTTNGSLVTLVSFDNAHGSGPSGSLIEDGEGVFYGTTLSGGSAGYGTVFSLSLPTPQLAITPSGPNLILSWPAFETAFALQSTYDLGVAAAWNPVSLTPAIVNGQNTVTIPLSGSQMFFRLMQ